MFNPETLAISLINCLSDSFRAVCVVCDEHADDLRNSDKRHALVKVIKRDWKKSAQTLALYLNRWRIASENPSMESLLNSSQQLPDSVFKRLPGMQSLSVFVDNSANKQVSDGIGRWADSLGLEAFSNDPLGFAADAIKYSFVIRQSVTTTDRAMSVENTVGEVLMSHKPESTRAAKSEEKPEPDPRTLIRKAAQTLSESPDGIVDALSEFVAGAGESCIVDRVMAALDGIVAKTKADAARQAITAAIKG